MPRGLPLKYIKKYGISKRAWREYRKDVGTFKRKYGVSPVPHNPRKKRKGGVRGLARWRRRRRRRRSMTIPVAPVIGLATGIFAPSAFGPTIAERIQQGRWTDAGKIAALQYLGYDVYTGKWDIFKARGLLPIAMGLLVHKFVGGSPLNLNRMLARHNIPLVRI